MSLTAANQARLDQALDKVYRFSDRTETFRQRIERGVYSHSETATIPVMTYNRHKWNRMNANEQAEYEKRLAETKTEYRLIYADDSLAFTPVPKLVHDWALSRLVTTHESI